MCVCGQEGAGRQGHCAALLLCLEPLGWRWHPSSPLTPCSVCPPSFLSHLPRCSITPTFAACAVFVNNARWDGVPFLLKAGKALHSRVAEIRVQFRHVPGNLYRNKLGLDLDKATNELVRREGSGWVLAGDGRVCAAGLFVCVWCGRWFGECGNLKRGRNERVRGNSSSMRCSPATVRATGAAALRRCPVSPPAALHNPPSVWRFSGLQVIRIQPNEGIYLKVNNKVPGLGLRIDTTRLDLTYKSKYEATLPGESQVAAACA